MEVRCLSQVIGDELVIYVQDPVGADNAASARATLLEHVERHPQYPVVLDLQKCTYIDTPGLGVLVEVKKLLAAAGRSLLLQNPSRPVLRMVNITLLNRVFPIRFTTREEERIPTSHKDGT
ncbi:MAG: STAS domain-containing protein [Candidatus Sumerlaeaceae bacterium]|nr:STAS domain-containing protein [Candidatus Sumerlaeaceae bacterium]